MTGNGKIDAGMVQVAALGIAILGPEGLATEARSAADVVCGSISDALDQHLNLDRLRATLRI